MVILNLILDYIIWHYTRAILDLLEIFHTFIWFAWNYFSIRQLSKTFLVPWRRLGEAPHSRWDFFERFSSLVISAMMILVGVLIRTLTILIGALAVVLVFVLGLLALALWVLMPFVLVFIFYLGLRLFIYEAK